MANPFAVEQKTYEQFPNDEFVDATLLAYFQADLPPGPLADTNDVVPCVKFLFGGYVKDDNGNIKTDDTGKPIIVRKWTNWMRISNNKKANIMKVFNGFGKDGVPALFDVLQDCADLGGKLWSMPYKILLEQSDKYQNIIKIKPGNNQKLVENVFYDDKYIPYKVVKAYGKTQCLTLACCKFSKGVKTFTPEEMAEPSSEG